MITPFSISPLDPTRAADIQARIDGKAKPPGALGRIESLAVQLAAASDPYEPSADKALLLLFAGDHGLNEEGVSAYPSSVTGLMVSTFLAGRASANAFAQATGADVRVVDSGVDAELAPHPDLIDAKIRRGTRNAAVEAAMTADEASAALKRGGDLARAALAEGYDVLALGEMGIGNTSSAALIMHRLAPADLADCIGVGAGHSDEGLARKHAVLERAAARSDAVDPLDVLREFGGFEIAMMAGAVLASAAQSRPILIDGFISSAAALVAVRLEPAALDYCIFAHRSAERGHDILLQSLGARPLLDLQLRLGEGTGALLALPLLRAATRMLRDVASLDDVLNGRL